MRILSPLFSLDLARYGIDTGMAPLRSQQVKESLSPSLFSSLEAYEAPRPLTPRELTLAHTIDFVRRLSLNPSEELARAYGLSLGRLAPEEELYGAILKAAATVWHGAQLILSRARASKGRRNGGYDEGFLLQCYAGAHHARSDGGSGFCLLNDVAIASRGLLKEGLAQKILIIDTDAHMGDGMAQILCADPSIVTFSIHGDFWPLGSPLPIVPSRVDVLIDEFNHYRYLGLLADALEGRSEIAGERFDFAFVLAGADAWEGDLLKSSSPLRLSERQMLERDMLVLDYLRRRGVPSLWLMAGGYGEESYRMYLNFLNASI